MRRVPSWAGPELIAALRSQGVQQARFHHEGNWFHPLQDFPAAYCMREPRGFVVFGSEEEFTNCSHLSLRKDVHTIRGETIASIPAFVRVS